MRKNELTPQEEKILVQLAQRQHESEDAESRLIERYGNRAALAKQVWGAIAGLLVVTVGGTGYVLGLKESIERNTRELVALRADTARNSDRIENIRLEMKDKADKTNR